MEKYQQIERSIIKTYRSKIWRMFIRAIDTYKLIEPNDKIAVCISGGKDSMLLAKCMQELQKHGDFPFELEFIAMNPGYNEENLNRLIENAKLLNIPLHIFNTNIFNVVSIQEESPCYLCARMRRGHLYAEAKKLGCNKIALGHHFNDVIETTLMSILYGAEFKTMMPKLHSENFEGMELIRPLYLVREDAIVAWTNYNDLRFLRCACKFTDDIENNLDSSKRQEVKDLIRNLKKVYDNIDINIFRSTHDVNLNTIIGYHDDNHKYNFLDDYKNKKTGKE